VLHPQMVAIFVYAATEKMYAETALQILNSGLHRIPFHADTGFYQPMPDVNIELRISSAGLGLRDNPTMIEAVHSLDVDVRLAARAHGPNARAKRLIASSLRMSALVAMRIANSATFMAARCSLSLPLHNNHFRAGVATMGKAVILTRISGQQDVIEDNVNGIYAPPGDPQAIPRAIVHLFDHRNDAHPREIPRKTIESTMSLNLWAPDIGLFVSS
jgi:hypothetical protein